MTDHETTPVQPEAETSSSGDVEESGGTPDDLDALRAALEQSRAQHARAVADYQNLERRSRERRAEAVRLAMGSLVADFLPVMDDLDRALEAAPESTEDAQWVEGVRLVAQKFAQVLAQHGVQEIPALGEAFDPAKHEAVSTAPGPEGQVVQLLRRGYTLHDHVVRPAMVLVGTGE
ncbi:MAG: nucleotide exchange factor GrpE [Dehalococcoidia bacterium]|nr:nucleotide exchange factor GrpE [Dehalococcoidia bacterium]